MVIISAAAWRRYEQGDPAMKMRATGAPRKSAAWCVADLEAMAERRLPRIVYDFLEGGAEDELSMAWNKDGFSRRRFVPQPLKGTATPAIGVDLFGASCPLPFGVAPIGLADLVWPGAAAALARLAGELGIPYILSTAASISIEQAAALAGDHLWFQLYAADDARVTDDLLRRAAAAGVNNLVFTVDVARPARRFRDLRHGLKPDFRPSFRQWSDFLRHPFWSAAIMRHGRPQLANMSAYKDLAEARRTQPGAFISAPRADWTTLHRLRAAWPGNLIVKGVLAPEEAVAIEAAGADGIIVSNHGGRQLDGVCAAIDALPAICEVLRPSTKVMLDSGIRRGSDVVKAFAEGAHFVFLGRSWLYAVAALGPEAGPPALVEILREELENVLTHLGCDRMPGRHCGVLSRS
ncbi:alpha-hydroxy acid oxidase [Sphingobium sp.]|uniref:alpha-hydroxy acid oxidase n=1 Tax=Sphingobium sp. TaxID=1912891 RepID=UPI0028BDDE57|nr:alpha-hydroxy acid oxidase [Sphingobium sp.]